MTTPPARPSNAADSKCAASQAAILDALPAHIALLDSHGDIIAVNQAWRRFAVANGFHGETFGVGDNYIHTCDRVQGHDVAIARAVATGIRDVLSGQAPDYATEYACHSASERRWFRITVNPLDSGEAAGVLVAHRDITESKRSEAELHRHLERLELLVEAKKQLAISDASPEQFIEEIPALTQRVTGADGAILELIEGDSLVYRAGSGIAAGKSGYRLGSDSSLSGQAVRLRQTLRCNDADTDPRVDAAVCRGLGLRSVMVSVLRDDKDTPVGVINVIARDAHRFNEGDMSNLDLLSESLGSVLRRKRAEQALRAREALLSNAQRVARLGTWELDVPSNRLSWSDETHRIFGVAPQEFANTFEAFFSLLHPDDARRLAPIYSNPPSDGSPVELQYRIIRPDGEQRVILERGEVSFDNQGDPLRKVGVAMDITEAKRTEYALRESEQRYKSLFEHNPDGVCSFDAKGRITSANEAFQRLSGYQWNKARSMSFRSLLPPQYVAPTEAYFRKALAGEAVNYEMPGIAQDGSLRQIDITNLPIVVDDEIVGVFGIARDITERKAAEARLQETRNMLRIAGRMARLGAWAVDLNESRVIWSDEVCAIHEVAPGTAPEVSGGFQYYAPEWRQTMRRVFAACEHNGTPFDEEVELITARGHRVWVRAIGEAVRDDSDKVVRIQGAIQDITVRKHAEANARRSVDKQAIIVRVQQELAAAKPDLQAVMDVAAERAQTLTDASGGAVELVDGDEMVYRAAVGSIQDQVGLRLGREGSLSGEAVRKGKVSLCDDSERDERVDRAIARKIGARSMIIAPLRAGDRPIGALKVVSDRPHGFTSSDVNHLQILAEALGASFQRIQAITRLQASEAQYRVLFEQNPNPMWVYDPRNLRFLAVNRAAVKHYGYSQDELLALTIRDIRPAEELAVLEQVLSTPRQTEGTFTVTRHRKKDGTVINVEVSSNSIVFNDQPARLVLAHDITERINLERQLKRAQRLEAIGQLTGGIAHDFNNLLTVILGNSELLAEQLADDPDAWLLADMARAAAQRGADLTHRLLAFSRRQALAPKAVQVNDLVTGMSSLVKRTLGGNIEIRTALQSDLPAALVDPAQLETALLNLCINARDAMPGGGHLAIETETAELDENYARRHAEVRVGRYIMLAVTDAGTGIAPEHLERVFDPFFTTKEKGKGSGLGLSMVYGFVKQSQGHLSIYSEIGHGTTVRMYLPLAEGPTEVAVDEPLPESLPRGSETILLVEDDNLVRRFAEGQLTELGYRVIAVGSGSEALEVARQNPTIDLLFTDVMMPGGMNGRELVEAASRLLPGLKVLYTSGYTENTIVHNGRLDPGIPFLHKPYRRLELARKVRAVLSDTHD